MPSITGWYDPTPKGGALRLAAHSYLPGAGDPGVRLAGLRRGDRVVLEDGRVRSVNGLPPEGVEGGNWLFDRVRAELVYVPNLTRFLSGGSDDPVPAIRFRIEVRKTTRHAYVGVGLTPVNGYRWEPGT